MAGLIRGGWVGCAYTGRAIVKIEKRKGVINQLGMHFFFNNKKS
jgi:hypothetical protein